MHELFRDWHSLEPLDRSKISCKRCLLFEWWFALRSLLFQNLSEISKAWSLWICFLFRSILSLLALPTPGFEIKELCCLSKNPLVLFWNWSAVPYRRQSTSDIVRAMLCTLEGCLFQNSASSARAAIWSIHILHQRNAKAAIEGE